MESSDLKYFVGFDIGGTNVKYLVREENNIVLSGFCETSKFNTCEDLLDYIYSIIDSIILKYEILNICGIGIGSKGRVTKSGVIISSSLKILNNLDLVTKLESKYDISTKVVNDASLPYYAISDNVCNKTIFIVTLGTGIGTSIFYNYKHLGDEFFSSKFARADFKDGNTEDYVSIRFLLNKIDEHNLNVKTPKELFNLANSGNQIAKNIFKEYGENIGEALSSVVDEFSVDEIYFCGGILKGKTLFLNSIKDSLDKFSTKNIPILKILNEKYEVGCFGASNMFLEINK